MTTYIALLRGINVGGKNMVAMADLRKHLTELGFEGVTTLLQSGNVVFQSQGGSVADIESQLCSEFAGRLGLNIDVYVRTAAEWGSVVQNNPFPKGAEADPSHLIVIFLRENVDAHALEAVRPLVKGRETFKAVGNHLYVVYPDGMGNSKLASTPGWNKLAAHGTARNWNTVLKLGALAANQGHKS